MQLNVSSPDVSSPDVSPTLDPTAFWHGSQKAEEYHVMWQVKRETASGYLAHLDPSVCPYDGYRWGFEPYHRFEHDRQWVLAHDILLDYATSRGLSLSLAREWAEELADDFICDVLSGLPEQWAISSTVLIKFSLDHTFQPSNLDPCAL